MTSQNLPVTRILLTILLTLTASLHAIRLQKITIFSENCCKGRNETFTNSIWDLDDVSTIAASGRLRSFSVHRGLWALYSHRNFTGSSVHQEGSNDDVLGNCGSGATGSGDFTQYKSMRYIGNPIVSLGGLNLFSENNFLGDELYFDGKELQLLKVFKFKSYGFTGKDSWTIISGSNHTNHSHCLRAHHNSITFLDAITEHNKSMTVRAIRRGCAKTQSDTRSAKHLQVQYGLNLYSKPNKVGDEIFTDGVELRLPKPIKVESYSYIGNRNWTVFKGTKFDGDFDCLVSLKKDGTPVNQIITVGSVRRGCKGDPVAEIITPPPEVNDRQTHANLAPRVFNHVNYGHVAAFSFPTVLINLLHL